MNQPPTYAAIAPRDAVTPPPQADRTPGYDDPGDNLEYLLAALADGFHPDDLARGALPPGPNRSRAPVEVGLIETLPATARAVQTHMAALIPHSRLRVLGPAAGLPPGPTHLTGLTAPETVNRICGGLTEAITHGCRVVYVGVGVPRTELTAPQRWQLVEAIENAYWAGTVVVVAATGQTLTQGRVPATLAGLVGVRAAEAAAWPSGGAGELAVRFVYALNAQIEFEAYAVDRLSQTWLAGRPGGSTPTQDPSAQDEPDRWLPPASAAAAQLTALAAQLLSLYPALKPFEIKTVLYRLAGRR